MNSAALDNWITGNWGEDSIDDTDAVEKFYATRYPNLSKRYKLSDLHADTQDRIRAEYDRAQLARR